MDSFKEQYIIENAICFKEMAEEAFKRYTALESEDTVQHHSFLTAVATNLTFAVELALKALCIVTDMPFSTKRNDGHNLFKLFNSLPPEIQLRLRHSYEYQIDHILKGDLGAFVIYINKHDKDQVHRALISYSNELDSLLETHQKAFIQWRYNFEGVNPIIFIDYYHLIMFFDLIRNAVEHEVQMLIKKAKIVQSQKSGEL